MCFIPSSPFHSGWTFAQVLFLDVPCIIAAVAFRRRHEASPLEMFSTTMHDQHKEALSFLFFPALPKVV
jgi:hypothetical protein